MASRRQLEILGQGAKAWNAWRDAHPGAAGPDLAAASLRSAALAGANLSAADLSGADLVKADLRGADLGRALLRVRTSPRRT